MATSKKNEFSPREIEMSELAKAFSHPARILIIDELTKHKDRTCKEIVGDLPLSQPTVSQHLKALYEAKLICRKYEGAKSLYCIEWNQMERFFTIYERLNTKMMQHRPKRNCC